MDHDLLLDLRHLDDPDPPRFGELRAEEAARRAAAAHSRRARLLAGAVLVVALVAGLGLTAIGDDRSPDTIEAAGRGEASPTTAALTPEGSTSIPTSAAPDPPAPAGGDGQPPPTAAAPAPPPTAVPGPTTTVPAGVPPPPGGPSGPVPSGAPPVPAPPAATGRSPEGRIPAPPGLRFTLSLDTDRVQPGGTVFGLARFENNRSTAVTLVGGGCDPFRTMLYENGKLANTHTCGAYFEKVLAPGAFFESGISATAEPGLRPGTYDVFSVINLREDGLGLHSNRQVVTVVRS